MKKLLTLLILLAAPAMAQESYTLSASAQQVADLTLIVTTTNQQTCVSLALAQGCTQAQACVAANAAGGASCTSTQAQAVGKRIYPQTLAGRQEFVGLAIALPAFNTMKASLVAPWEFASLCQFWATANQTQKDAICTAGGRATGCLLCP